MKQVEKNFPIIIVEPFPRVEILKDLTGNKISGEKRQKVRLEIDE